MTHFICTGGCKKVSSTEGVCESENCPKNGELLEECNCDNAEHLDRVDASGELDMDGEEIKDSESF